MPPVTPDYQDQIDIFNPSKATALHLIGVGGIGASALVVLVTLGFKEIHLWDMDLVERRNMASTLMFAPEHLGQPKVEVAKDYLIRYGAVTVVIHQERFQSEQHVDTLEGIVISAVDDMEVRKDIWQAIKGDSLGLVNLFIDGRIGGEVCTMITLDPLDAWLCKWYEEFQLYSNAEAVQLPCTQRAVVYAAGELGNRMAAAVACHQRELPIPYWFQVHMQHFTQQALWRKDGK